jgi:hypothetical protein
VRDLRERALMAGMADSVRASKVVQPADLCGIPKAYTNALRAGEPA